MPDLLFLNLEQLFFFFLFLLIILFKLTTALFKSKKVLQLTITRFRTFTIVFSFLSSIISAHLLFSGIEMIAHYSHENLDITKSVLFSNHRMLYYIFLMLFVSLLLLLCFISIITILVNIIIIIIISISHIIILLLLLHTYVLIFIILILILVCILYYYYYDLCILLLSFWITLILQYYVD